MHKTANEAFGLSEKEYEEMITKACAATAEFDAHGSYMVCRLCGVKLKIIYQGKSLNERMLDHFDRHLKNPPVR